MGDGIHDIDASTLDDLSRLKEEQEVLRGRMAAMDERRGSVSEAVFTRVRGDYERRLEDLVEEARPLKEAARAEYGRLEALCAALAEAQAEARLVREEIEFRHELGEFAEEDYEARRDEAEGELTARDGAVAEAEALRERFLAAVDSPQDLAAEPPPEEAADEGAEAADPADPPTEEGALDADAAGAVGSAEDDWSGDEDDTDIGRARPAATTAASGGTWMRSGLGGSPGGSGSGLPPPPPAAEAPAAGEAGEREPTERTLIAETIAAGSGWREPSGSGPTRDEERPADDGAWGEEAAGEEGAGEESGDETTVAADQDAETWDDAAATLRPGQLSSAELAAAEAAGAGEGSGDVESTQATKIIAQPRLVTVEGGRAGQSFVLRAGMTTTIGRSSENLVHLLEEAVSRRHAEVIPGPDGYLLRDLDSENGVYVNGKRKKEHVLADGDVVQIGVRRFVFRDV